MTVALVAGSLLWVSVSAQTRGSEPAATKTLKLAPQDYLDTQQLVARYAFAIDKCTNSGYDYADLYTRDGVFSVADENGALGNLRFEGREKLAQAAGGGASGCRDPKSLPGYGASHIMVNHVITPSRDRMGDLSPAELLPVEHRQP